MYYIVLDLEWNQPVSRDTHAYQKYGNRLTSEIIQFGAVKLDQNKRIIDSFESMVQPQCYKKLHPHVKRLTSITQQAIDNAPRFPQVAEAFHRWCGKDGTYVFLTWGYDDMPALESNLAFIIWIPHGSIDGITYRLFSISRRNRQQSKGAFRGNRILSARAGRPVS